MKASKWPKGEDFIDAPVTDGSRLVRVTAVRDDWPDTGGEVLELEVFCDGEWIAKCGAMGGTHVNRSGEEVPVTTLTTPIPADASDVRVLFRRMVPLRTGIAVEFL